MNIQNAALLIIDMQYDFVGEHAVIPCKCHPDMIKNLKKMIGFFHDNQLPVIYTQEEHRKSMIDFGRELDGDEPVHCLEGTEGVKIIEQLAPSQQDHVIRKRRYSAFFQTDLKLLLDSLKIDTLVITGAATDVCVRISATDAQQYGYYVFVPKDCVAGTTVSQHEAALEHIRYVLGTITTSEEICREKILEQRE